MIVCPCVNVWEYEGQINVARAGGKGRLRAEDEEKANIMKQRREDFIFCEGRGYRIHVNMLEEKSGRKKSGNYICPIDFYWGLNREHGESAMAGRESMMQVRCTGLQKEVTGSAHSELRKTRPCQLKLKEESGF
ncbi:hypothetical protein NDU88_000938 [Pleurodeles waltl]|uniref:Uncharacterized protein n=1 Tax=Pleurodeles waltl TaxID=8319 RepID=A0AAV7U5H1_PLEWA|nr:hypothetical protein NDU88_000938 [Pleurodeles waltl]